MKRILALMLAAVFVLVMAAPALGVSASAKAGVSLKAQAGVCTQDCDQTQDRLQERDRERTSWDKEAAGQGNAFGWRHRLTVNGQVYQFGDVPPVIKEDRVLIPLRAVMAALGAEVKWDAETKTVTIIGDKTVVIKVDSKVVIVDGEEQTLDVPAKNVNCRVVVPLRFIAQALGCKVDFNAQTQTVSVVSADAS